MSSTADQYSGTQLKEAKVVATADSLKRQSPVLMKMAELFMVSRQANSRANLENRVL
jgi:hypothetical protein